MFSASQPSTSLVQLECDPGVPFSDSAASASRACVPMRCPSRWTSRGPECGSVRAGTTSRLSAADSCSSSTPARIKKSTSRSTCSGPTPRACSSAGPTAVGQLGRHRAAVKLPRAQWDRAQLIQPGAICDGAARVRQVGMFCGRPGRCVLHRLPGIGGPRADQLCHDSGNGGADRRAGIHPARGVRRDHAAGLGVGVGVIPGARHRHRHRPGRGSALSSTCAA